MKQNATLALLFLTGAVSLALAASPSALVNYQGVLRNASNAPLSGTFDMVFRFYDAMAGGNEILVDSHTAVGGSPITVSGGLFNVQLGSGVLTDGVGPGVYSSLAEVFASYGTVYLSVQVGSEVLTPRTRIVSAAYSLNSDNLDGRSSEAFAQLGVANVFTTGPQTIQAGSVATKGLIVRAVGGQAVNLQEWQNSVGTAVTSVRPDGTFSGDGSGLTGLNASSLASGAVPDGRLSGTYSAAMTFSNASNSFTGSGSGLTNVNADKLDGHDSTEFAPSGRISVKSHGAVGDDVTDDTGSIQSAIDAAGPDKCVYFPAATYKTTSTLTVGTRPCLLGDGSQKSILHNTMTSCLSKKGSTPTVFDAQISGIGCRDNNTGASTTPGWDFTEFYHGYFVDLDVWYKEVGYFFARTAVGSGTFFNTGVHLNGNDIKTCFKFDPAFSSNANSFYRVVCDTRAGTWGNTGTIGLDITGNANNFYDVYIAGAGAGSIAVRFVGGAANQVHGLYAESAMTDIDSTGSGSPNFVDGMVHDGLATMIILDSAENALNWRFDGESVTLNGSPAPAIRMREKSMWAGGTGTTTLPTAHGGVLAFGIATAVASNQEIDTQTTVPQSGLRTIKNLRCDVTVPPGGGASYILTVRENQDDTLLACTIAGTAASCSDTTHIYSNRPAGFKYNMRSTTIGSPAVPTTARCVVELYG